jgi:O-antigen/teichoic acid export membrane protein
MFREVKTIIKHSSVYGIANLLQKGVGFLMIPVYTHYLTPSEYGILELMDLTITVITMLIGMGLGSAIIRFYHHHDNIEDKNEVFTTSLIFTFVLCLITVSCLQCFPKYFAEIVLGEPEYYRYFQIMFIAMGLQTIASSPECLLLAKKEAVIFSTITIGTFVSYLTLNILFLVVFKIGLIGLLLSILITKVLNTSSLLIITLRHIKLVFSFMKLKEMVNFGMPLVLASIGMFIIHFSDRFFVQRFCDLNVLGVYSLGYKFGMILTVFVFAPFFRIWDVERFEIAKRDNGKGVFTRIFTYYSAAIIFVGLVISVLIDEAVYIMAAPEYQGASSVVPLIVLGYILNGMGNFFSLGVMVTKKTRYAAYVTLFVAGINILLNIFLINRYGIMGAAIATVLTFLLLAIFNYVISQKLYPIPLEYGRVFVLFALSFCIYGLSCLVGKPLLISIGAKSLLLIAFPAALFWGKFFYEDEITKGTEVLKVIVFRFGIGRRFLKFAEQLKK